MTAYSTLTFTCIISAMAVGAIIIGVSLMDSPSVARAEKLDARRINDLERISANINRYHHVRNVLPERLEQAQIVSADPVTQQPYEYKVTGVDSYQLCAVFDSVPDNSNETYISYNNCTPDWNKHGKGRTCYDISVKPCH